MKLTVETYTELTALIAAWAEHKRMPLLAITSRPGLGKTEAARKIATTLVETDSAPLTIDTHVTPMHLYVQAYLGRDKPIILDDLTDRVLSNQIALSILKSLCDSREERKVEYNSTSPWLAANDIPASFVTRSPVLLLSNVFAVITPQQIALASRAVHCEFRPSQSEVLAYVNTWARTPEILSWFQAHIELFPDFSARDYAVCEQLAESKLDWRDYALRSADPVAAEVVRLLDTLPTEAARLAAFTGGRATWYRVKARLKNRHQTVQPGGRIRNRLGRPSRHPKALQLQLAAKAAKKG